MNCLNRVSAAQIILTLILTGCSQPQAAPQNTEFLGHHLGESPTIWKMVEDPLGPSPTEVCQDIIKSGAGAETDRYKDCAIFLKTGEYSIKTRDWQTYREREFFFEGWKLALIAEKYPASEYETVKTEMTARFGAPGKIDSDSASWQEPDVTIRIGRKNDEGTASALPNSLK